MKIDRIPGNVRAAIRTSSKCGFLSRRIWREFFSRGNIRWQNRQWLALIDEKLFEPVADYGFTESAVRLTEKGTEAAIRLGFDPVSPPPSKNLWHDEELIRLALRMEREGWISFWMTEMELKSNKWDYSKLVSERSDIKYPDLLIQWRRPEKKVYWAIELERSRKEFTRYYDMIGRYKGTSSIDSVLVIAATLGIEENIKKAASKMSYPQMQRPMLFSSLADVMRDHRLCELRVGAQRTSLGKMAEQLTGKKAIEAVAIIK